MNGILLMALAALLLGDEYDRREVVAPGISYRERRVMKGGDGRETASAMARRLGATATVNGSYFLTTGPYAGGSSGVYLSNGEVVGLPASSTWSGWSSRPLEDGSGSMVRGRHGCGLKPNLAPG